MEEDYDHDCAGAPAEGDPAQAFEALRAEVAALRQVIEAAAEREAARVLTGLDHGADRRDGAVRLA